MKVSSFTRSIWLAGLFSVAALPAFAQEDLYDAVAPPDSGYVRLLNSSDQPLVLKISGYDKEHVAPSGQFSPYIFLSPGRYDITVGNEKTTLELATKQTMTLAANGSTLSALNDDIAQSAKKALIGFYNFSDQPMALKTQDGKVAIVDTLEPGKSGFREVNEVNIALSVYHDGEKVSDYESTLLRKGRSYSYLVFGAPGQYKTRIGNSEVDSPE